jgi:hypothetical protein
MPVKEKGLWGRIECFTLGSKIGLSQSYALCLGSFTILLQV